MVYYFQEDKRTELRASFHAFAIYVRMLTYILSSKSMETHLKVFLKVEMLATLIPYSHYQGVYKTFAENEGHRLRRQ